MKLIRVNDLVLCLEDETKPPKQSKHYFTIGGKQAADFLMECFNKQQASTPDPLYQAMHDFRDDVLSGIDGLDNDQINAVLSTFDNYMLDDPDAPAELQGIPTRIGVSTCPSEDGKRIIVMGMAVQEGISFVFYTGNHSITQDASGFVDLNFQRFKEKE